MNLKTLILKAALYFNTHSFARRCVSTIALLTILFCVVYFGKIYGAIALITLISTLALYEFYKLNYHHYLYNISNHPEHLCFQSYQAFHLYPS